MLSSRILRTLPLFIFLLFAVYIVQAQNPGDTIFVKAFDYESATRDSLVQYPDGNLSYEKILMKYNMRCKGAKVSSGNNPNLGCGEWDYSCNTYIVDSSKVERLPSFYPSHLISSFEGTEFNYTSQIIRDYYQFVLQEVNVNVFSETEFNVSTDNSETVDYMVADLSKSGKTQFLYSKDELINNGFSAGNIQGIGLEVEDNGADVTFLSVQARMTNASALDPNDPERAGFSQVYFDNFSFVPGLNKIYFTEEFVWDGEQNILFEFSYTNSNGQQALAFKGMETDATESIYTKNNTAIDLVQNGYVDINPSNLSSIEDEVTVSFWSYGDEDALPKNTSILWAYDENEADREINIHLPWNNEQVYFDCGFDGGFDRINKTASANNYKGKWTFWTFSKNASSGNMKIYINGNLWHSGTGLTRDLKISEMILGVNSDFKNYWNGYISEFRVWDKELAANTIKSWYRAELTSEHPDYDNLVAHYTFEEGQGSAVNDVKNNVQSQGTGISWKFERGDKLYKGFKPSKIKPSIRLYSGEYDITISEKITLDSLDRNPNFVQKISIESNEGTVFDDDIVFDEEYYVYEAKPAIIYDGETNEILNTIDVVKEGTIEITQLDYVRRFPFYNEIMSFVTPYGINLDLGVDGKTWYFDVSDFEPILKGDKRMLLTLGGQNQEEMDIEFLFIVGTPVRDVLEFDQLWQGTNRVGAANINQISDEVKFAPMQKTVIEGAHTYKMRSTITGHGAEGEFQQVGGQIYHSLNVDGDFEEYTWPVSRECSLNPIYPQGGTWVFDRQGWCPGEASLLTENDFTDFLTPGSSHTFDYTTSNANILGGDYRYHASHQLVSYGPPNHTNDASIIDIKAPNSNALHTRSNPMCSDPIIVLQNTGASKLTTVEFSYWINDQTEKQNFTWTGDLDFLEKAEVTLPNNDMFKGLMGGDHKFYVEISSTDDYAFNNRYISDFTSPDLLPNEIIFEIKTNNVPQENSYTIVDENGVVVSSIGLVQGNKVYTDNLSLAGCYTLQITDTAGDGLQWWANAAQGTGYAKIKDINGSTLHTLEADFGGEITYSFGAGSFTDTQEEWVGELELYPNPNLGNFVIKGEDLLNVDVRLFDMLGQELQTEMEHSNTEVYVDASKLQAGMYLVKLNRGNQSISKKVMIIND